MILRVGGVIFGALEVTFGHLEVICRALGVIFGVSRSKMMPRGSSGGPWEAFRLGGLGEPWGSLGEPLGGHVGGFWGHVAVFCGGCVVKRENVKSVVLLNESDVFRGGWELDGDILRRESPNETGNM